MPGLFAKRIGRWFLGFALCFSGLLTGESFSRESLTGLEKRREAVVAELDSLALLSLRSGMGAVGFRSRPQKNVDDPVWVEIDLDGERTIDQVVLVPMLWRGVVGDQVDPDAFPAGFRIVVGGVGEKKGKVIAELSEKDKFLPRIAPLVVNFPETAAAWVRIEVTELTEMREVPRFLLQLSEVFVFSGEENVALHRPVRCFPGYPDNVSSPFDPRFLVDEATPFSMDAAGDTGRHAYLSTIGDHPSLNIDLGSPMDLSRIRFHAVEQHNVIPQAYAGDLGIPKRFRVLGAQKRNFSDAVVLIDHSWPTIYDIGPIMEWEFPVVTCRYVRVVDVEPNPSIGVNMDVSRIGFSEIELLADGRNVAKGKKAWLTGGEKSSRSPLLLTDGYNAFGEILGLREWMNQLAKRHDLEVELHQLDTRIAQVYSKQRRVLNWALWAIVLLLFLIAALIWVGKAVQKRNETRVRNRIAANLHDELGANLHAIGMLGDLAKNSFEHRGQLEETMDRIRSLTERTGAAARNCAHMVLAKGICEDLVNDMRREAERLLCDLEYEMSVEGEHLLAGLKRRKKIDLYLFHKECLVNIIRHSGATVVSMKLEATPKNIMLQIADNGTGFDGTSPPSLVRRARLLGGRVRAVRGVDGGAVITLVMKTGRTWGFI